MSPSLLLSLVLFAAPAIAHNARDEPPKPVHADSRLAEVAAVADGFNSAIKTADFDRVRQLLDPEVVILESGGAERSRDEYLGHHAIADAAFLRGATVKILHRNGRVGRDSAWLATESEIVSSATSGGKPLRSTETMVLAHGSDGWKIVHIHWSSGAMPATAP